MQLLSVFDAAKRLGVSTCTVRRLITLRSIVPVRIGRRVLVSESEIQRIIIPGSPCPKGGQK
jgi:excisionase family DNA binding protein